MSDPIFPVSGVGKNLICGVIDASIAANVPLTTEPERNYELLRLKRNPGKRRAKEVLADLPDDVVALLDDLYHDAGSICKILVNTREFTLEFN